ncbi:MAG: mreC [Ilumatobacteraceae bacterium]|nr:mreC [Ilumatobacteraceae bacterium]
MAVYSVNRRRAIILLILSSVLLLTLDLRGNPLIDRTRSAFATVLSPFETAARVIANPIRNAWHGATDYDRLKKENDALRDQVAQQRGNDLAARAVVGDYQELLTLQGLTAAYPSVTARVVGGAPGNFEQTVEIDRGGTDGIQVGMAVVNKGGLIGKITKVYDDRAVVRLVTDADYAIECKVSGTDAGTAGGATAAGGTTSDGTSTTTADTTPSGEKVSDLSTTTTEVPTTTAVPVTAPDGTPITGIDTPTTQFGDTTTTTPTNTTTTVPATTTTVPFLVTRETGGCVGRGFGNLPAMQYVTENPSFGTIDIGDVISTTGGSTSLAPPDIVIGEVINKVQRAGSSGPLLEIKLGADLDHLNFVRIVLYVPPSEVPGAG